MSSIHDDPEFSSTSDHLDFEILYGKAVVIDPRTRVFLEYWKSACRGRSMPSRGDIDPLAMPSALLPNLALVDVVEGGARFRFRLVGSEVGSAWGLSLTGKFVCDPVSNRDYGDYVLELYRTVLRSCRPVLSVSNWAHPDLEHINTQRIFCPLSEDGKTVNMVFAHQIFDSDPRRWGEFDLTGPEPFRRLFDAIIR